MTTKTIKTLVFASLIAAMILPFSDMSMASAENSNTATYDPIVATYLNTVLSASEPIVKYNTVGGTDYVETITVDQINSKVFQIETIIEANGEVDNVENVIVILHKDGTYQIINTKHGINERFTTVDDGISTRGSGSSDGSGARIDLYDSAYGVNVGLDDSYSACWAQSADFDGTVDGDNGFSYFDTNMSDYYNHLCFITHYWDRANLVHEGSTHYFNDSGYEYVTFTHGGGLGTYTADMTVYYGNW
ncbi:MAG: hypothetical protein OEL77_02885 [Nitrosopumilus sp.]|nr:hypothetical protein [Nitrosopumilus sp.]MDH3384940.1 hypothetical protein [Nitrosopumilus sp.]